MDPVANGNVSAAPQPVSNSNAPAGQPAPSTPAAPAIDPQEFARLQRIEQQFKGVQPFVEKARGFGFTDEKALEAWGGFAKAASTRGFSPQNLSAMFSDSGAGDARSGDEAVAITEEHLKRELSSVEERAVRKFHEQQHQRELDADYAELSEERLAKELDGLPDEFKDIAKSAMHGLYFKARPAYGENHPLKGQFGAVGKEGIAGIYNNFKTAWKAIEAKAKGTALGDIGNAARKQVNTTVAGNGANQGTPNTSAPNSPDARRERLQNIAGKVMAKKAAS